MDASILEDLGLTRAETAVYLTLLELGSSTAGLVLNKSKLQNSVLHRALNSLIEKGLINFVLDGKRRVYQATDPENFHNFIDDKKKRFDELLPELKNKQKLSESKENATVYKGIRGLKEVYNIMINANGEEYNTFGGGRECVNRMGITWWKNIHAKRIANKLKSRQVFDETVRKSCSEILKRPMTNVRFVSGEFASFQETVLVGNLVAINVFTENPYSFLIKDTNVAKSYKQYFELLWRTAKK